MGKSRGVSVLPTRPTRPWKRMAYPGFVPTPKGPAVPWSGYRKATSALVNGSSRRISAGTFPGFGYRPITCLSGHSGKASS
jgi:hypothetical protein